MSVEVILPPSLQSIISGLRSVAVKGRTVGECLDDLVAKYPGLRPSLFNDDKSLQKGFSIFVNKENAHPEGLCKPVQDEDKIYIMNILVGG
jgi:molybdopterin converting factor small subunit